MNTCKDCVYWYDYEKLNYEGQCRRYAPTVQLLITTVRYDNAPKTLFPITNNQDWCGDFFRRPE